MTKEQLQERLNKLIGERAAYITMYDGAIQECKHWLEQLDVKDNTEQPSKSAE